jgi:hypothetical protein
MPNRHAVNICPACHLNIAEDRGSGLSRHELCPRCFFHPAFDGAPETYRRRHRRHFQRGRWTGAWSLFSRRASTRVP